MGLDLGDFDCFSSGVEFTDDTDEDVLLPSEFKPEGL